MKQKLKKSLRMSLFLFVTLVVQKPLTFFLSLKYRTFDYVFLVYPGTQRDLDGYCPRWLANSIYRNKISFAGVITVPKTQTIGRGVIIVIPNTVKALLRSSDDCLVIKNELQKLAKKLSIKSVAIAGRGPSIFLRHGIELDGLFVPGAMGMVFCTVKSLEDIVKKHFLSVSKSKLKICIFGAGRVGQTISDSLEDLSYNVTIVKINSVFDKNSNVGFKDSKTIISESDIIIVISAKGSDIYPYMKDMKDGAVVIDDTHPRMKKTFDRGFVYRASLSLPGANFLPSLPNYNSDSIPGCVVEAMVKSSQGEFDSQESFNQKANTIGFTTQIFT